MADVEKVVKRTVTDALIEAMESAGDMEHVLILSIPEGQATASKFFTDGDQTIAETLWMVEAFKMHLLGGRD